MAYNNSLTNQEESRFWLQILGDKANILAYRFAPEYTAEITQLKLFSTSYYNLAKQARQENLTEEQIKQLNIKSLQATEDFYQYVKGILRRQLLEKFYISILPEEVNTIINIANMYLYILNEFIRKRIPNFDPTYFLGFWLPIIAAQTLFIENNVGIYFFEFKQRVGNYSKNFLNNEIRIRENISFIQNGISDFPMNREVLSEIYDRLSTYESFIIDTMILVEQKKLPSSLTPVYLDHIYRIVCYVATELSLMLDKKRPECDPGGYPALINHYTII